MTDTIRVYVTCDRHGQRGPLYSARLGTPDGDVLVTGTTEPALAAARVLIGRGYAPGSIIEMWDVERPFPRLRGVLDVMAGQTVMETAAGSGPRFGRYVAFQDANSRDSGSAKTGVQPLPATQIAPDAPASVRKSSDSNPDLSGEAAP